VESRRALDLLDQPFEPPAPVAVEVAEVGEARRGAGLLDQRLGVERPPDGVRREPTRPCS
jgi:hypothetical protein